MVEWRLARPNQQTERNAGSSATSSTTWSLPKPNSRLRDENQRVITRAKTEVYFKTCWGLKNKVAFEYIYRQNFSSISDQGLLQFKNTYKLAATAPEIVFYYINVEEM